MQQLQQKIFMVKLWTRLHCDWSTIRVRIHCSARFVHISVNDEKNHHLESRQNEIGKIKETGPVLQI